MSGELIAFLNARLDEDEAAAKKAVELGAGVWALAPHFHTARHSPARVLREVEAKRLLLYQFEHRGNSVRSTIAPATGGVWDDLLLLLALPYSDHPDYRPEWKP